MGSGEGGLCIVNVALGTQGEMDMASIKDICDGLEILAKYVKPMDGGATGRDVHLGGADHDVIWGPEIVGPLNEADRITINDLGWHYSDENECWSHFC